MLNSVPVYSSFLRMVSGVSQHKTLLARFFSNQVLIQFFGLINGFLLLRWLSIEEQAVFSLAFSFQILLAGLSDLGFSGSIVALTGSGFADKKILGSYIYSARKLRSTFYLVSVLITCTIAPFVIIKSSLENVSVWISFIPVIVAVYWQADMGIYASPLIIHRKLNIYYRPQLVAAVIKISINYLLFLTHVINSLTTLVLNGLIIYFISRKYKKSSAIYFTGVADVRQAKKRMLNYLVPIMPSNIFNCFFGQVQIVIIACFGKVHNIAEVAALGRLSQIYLVMAAFNLVMVEPMIARADGGSLSKKYIMIGSAAILLALTSTLYAYWYPGVFLFILGSKYANLSEQVVWLLAAAGVNFVANTLWTMSSARKWIFWWGTIAYIVTVTICQVIGILKFDVSSTTGVLQLSLLTASGILLVQLAIAVAGFAKERMNLQTRYVVNPERS